jgi:hypothetical protein
MLWRTAGAALCASSLLLSCGSSEKRHLAEATSTTHPSRTFTTGFESLHDFAGMYISPQTSSTRHALVASPHHTGKQAHCGWLIGPGTIADTDGPNHRGYPTVQLWRLPGGGFATPAVIDLWVWANVRMKRGDWVSLATLSADASDHWKRVVTVNLDPGGWVNVFHVPEHGQHITEIETHRPFPMRKWVHLSITIDFDPRQGRITVLQDDELVARARVRGGHSRLEQAHFGIYAIPSLTAGKVCNDDLTITAAAES